MQSLHNSDDNPAYNNHNNQADDLNHRTGYDHDDADRKTRDNR